MLRAAIPFAALLAAFLSAPSAHAQYRPRILDESQYRRLGLELVWTSQVQLDASRTEVAQLSLQVVGRDSYESLQQNSYEVVEVRYGDDRVRRFSENDAGRDGQPMGNAEARRLAEKLMIQLEARGFTPKMEVKRVPFTVLYAQSSGGTLHALDAETGQTLWAVGIGNPRYPNQRPAANDKYVATISGSRLFVLDRLTGEPVWDRLLRQTPTMGPALSSSMVFVPGLKGQVEGYYLPTEESDNRGRPAWIYNSGARISARPAATDDTVSWATTDGVMFVAAVEGPRMMYRRQTAGPIFGQAAFLPPDQLVIASTDGYVTAINELDGDLQWTFSTGYAMFQTPLALPDHVYAVSRLGNMFCIDSKEGTELWVTPGIEEVIASSTQRVYVRDNVGRLVALDKRTGAKLAGIPTGGFGMSLANNVTDRIYLVSNTGVIQCLREIDSSFPIVHRPLPTEPQEDEGTPASRRSRQPAEQEPAAPARQAPANPFGDGFGDDLFGGDAAAGDAADDAGADDAEMDEPADDAASPFGFDGGAADEDPAAEDGEDAADEGEAFDDPFDFG